MVEPDISSKSKQLLADGLLSNFYRATTQAEDETDLPTRVRDIAIAVKETKIGFRHVAAAYFAEITGAVEDTSHIKDLFDEVFQELISEDYAMGFLTELLQYEEKRRQYYGIS